MRVRVRVRTGWPPGMGLSSMTTLPYWSAEPNAGGRAGAGSQVSPSLRLPILRRLAAAHLPAEARKGGIHHTRSAPPAAHRSASAGGSRPPPTAARCASCRSPRTRRSAEPCAHAAAAGRGGEGGREGGAGRRRRVRPRCPPLMRGGATGSRLDRPLLLVRTTRRSTCPRAYPGVSGGRRAASRGAGP